jgi:hypothetical protein
MKDSKGRRFHWLNATAQYSIESERRHKKMHYVSLSEIGYVKITDMQILLTKSRTVFCIYFNIREVIRDMSTSQADFSTTGTTNARNSCTYKNVLKTMYRQVNWRINTPA